MQTEQPPSVVTANNNRDSPQQPIYSGFWPNIEVNRLPPVRARKKSIFKKCFEKVMPFTSTAAMLLILYIIRAYLMYYVPAILAVANDPDVSKHLNKSITRIYVETAVFIFLSFSCFYILVFKLWCKCLPLAADPGNITEKLED